MYLPRSGVTAIVGVTHVTSTALSVRLIGFMKVPSKRKRKSHQRWSPRCVASAVFDRYNIVNERELLQAGQQLATYLARSI
jgi:hypothetical protein